jgi:dTDP-4-dehydrorhamnose 3,5-epimerase
MKIESEPLPSAFVLCPRVYQDHRGLFVKPYNVEVFGSLGLSFFPKEEFYSISSRGVLRGMHFQVPPYDHDKVVYCINGHVLDVILDMRQSSPTYGKSAAIELSGQNRRVFWIPKGFAHGFLSLDEGSTLVYLTSTPYSSEHDRGVHWNSFNFAWPIGDYIVSSRDACLPDFKGWSNPFL